MVRTLLNTTILFLSLATTVHGELLEVDHKLYIGAKKTITDEYQSIIDRQTNPYVRDLLIKAHSLATQNIRYSLYASKLKTEVVNNKKVKWLSCSGLAYELFKAIGLEYPLYTNTKKMVKYKTQAPYLLDYFEIQELKNQPEKGFRPQTGDILAYYYFNSKTKVGKGHVVIVIDPDECTAINSTTWSFDEDTSERLTQKKGVYFQRIDTERCTNGLWKSWDTASNKFQVLLRHKKFI